MPFALRTSSSWPGFMLFCCSIVATAFLISASVALIFLCFASWTCSFSSISCRRTWAARRWRACGVSGILVDSMTIRMREARSVTEITSSLTTAAIRISGYGAPGGGADGGRGACGEAADAVAGARETPQRTIRRTQNQRIPFMDQQLRAALRTAHPTLSGRSCRQREGVGPIKGRSKFKMVTLPAADRRDGAADLAEILEYHAEQHADARGDGAVSYPRLGQRADKGHAFVLVDRRQRGVEAGAAGFRRHHPVDDV